MAGRPVTIQIPSGSTTFDGFVFDNRTAASVVRIEGQPGLLTTIGRRGATSSAEGQSAVAASRRRLAVSGIDPPIFSLRAGTAARVYLSNLRIEGKVYVEDGVLELNNCTLDGLHSPEPSASSATTGTDACVSDDETCQSLRAIGIYVTGGSVVLTDTQVSGFEQGGMDILAGGVTAHGGTIRHNGRSASARFGGVQVAGGTLALNGTMVEGNGFVHRDCTANRCVQGGGLRLGSFKGSYGRASLMAGAQLKDNQAYAGSSVYIENYVADEWRKQFDQNLPISHQRYRNPVTYDLPTLPAHYVVIMGEGSTAEISKGLMYACRFAPSTPASAHPLANASPRSLGHALL